MFQCYYLCECFRIDIYFLNEYEIVRDWCEVKYIVNKSNNYINVIVYKILDKFSLFWVFFMLYYCLEMF